MALKGSLNTYQIHTMDITHEYQMGIYSSTHEFNILQKRFRNTPSEWRVHSWKISEGDGSITVLWERFGLSTADKAVKRAKSSNNTDTTSGKEFDAIAENGKEACSDTSQSCETCKHRYSSHCEKCLLNPHSCRSAEACVNCYTPIQ